MLALILAAQTVVVYLMMAWSPVTKATKYDIQLQMGGGDFTTVATVDSGTLTYKVAVTAPLGQQYCVRPVATLSDGTQAPGAPTCSLIGTVYVTLDPASPDTILITTKPGDQVTISRRPDDGSTLKPILVNSKTVVFVNGNLCTTIVCQ